MRRLVSVLLFFYLATGISSFSVTTNNPNVKVKENEGADLTCSYSADFGSSPRIEWKFKDKKDSLVFVVYDGKPTDSYSSRVTLHNANLRFSKVTRNDNGEYICEVSSTSGQPGQTTVSLTVLVPPSVPRCEIPQSVTTNKPNILTCNDPDSSPPPTYNWYKDGTLLPVDPKQIAAFKNATYNLNPNTGTLEFPNAAKTDSGQYYCEVMNEAGPPQRCSAVRMEVRDLNTGGIVAGVIIILLLVALVIFGVWYAKKKGYLPKKSESKPNVVYQPTSQYGGGGGDDNQGDFKQKSSFVV